MAVSNRLFPLGAGRQTASKWLAASSRGKPTVAAATLPWLHNLSLLFWRGDPSPIDRTILCRLSMQQVRYLICRKILLFASIVRFRLSGIVLFLFSGLRAGGRSCHWSQRARKTLRFSHGWISLFLFLILRARIGGIEKVAQLISAETRTNEVWKEKKKIGGVLVVDWTLRSKVKEHFVRRSCVLHICRCQICRLGQRECIRKNTWVQENATLKRVAWTYQFRTTSYHPVP